MASLNVAEWTPDQVADWLSGLGPTVARYIPELRRRQLDGVKLLTLRCDDLEYLGMHIIGHQELLLEAVEHLRNFQYEARRECVQQLALKVSAVATSLARALRLQPDARLDPQALALVAGTVRAVKPLVCWLERWAPGGASGLAERKAALLKLALEACTSAQRDRFAEQPARAVAAAAASAAAAADYIIQDVCDPMILQPASIDTVTLRQGEKPLGFDVVPSFCGHHQLADIRFGSPAHACGAMHDGDEIVQVAGRCVIGWSGAAVVSLMTKTAAELGQLPLRLRRRTPALATPRLHRLHAHIHRYEPSPLREEPPPARESPVSSDSELSPPASPTQHLSSTRLYPPPPRAAPQRRHSISGGSPVAKRPSLTIEQFWQQLRSQRWERGTSAAHSPEPDAFYLRDKALSCSTGLELSPRPRTCLGVRAPPPPPPAPPLADPAPAPRLDKSHSTPAYDFGGREPGELVTQVIPEAATTPTDSPTILVHSAEKADQILDFKKSSSAIGEAILQQQKSRTSDERTEFPFGESVASDRQRVLETINIAMMQHRRRDHDDRPNRPPPPPPRPAATLRAPPPAPPPAPASPASPPSPPQYPPLRAVPRPQNVTPPTDYSPLKKHIDANQISLPLRHITKHDLKLIPSERRELPPINLESPPSPASPAPPPRRDGDVIMSPAHTPSSNKSIFPTSKSRSLKKKSSILAKRRMVPCRALAGRCAAGGVWQRVRARAAAAPRWARRHLLLAHNLLYAYRSVECNRADCMIYLEGFTVSAATEVKSRAHAFKVYHTGTAFYFACDSHDAMTTWIQLIHRATLLPKLTTTQTDISKQYSETDYSETESDTEGSERRNEREREREKEKDKSKFGSLKKLAHRTPRSESQESVHATSLDRKYLRFFSRHKTKDEPKPAKTKQAVPVPTEHYRSYRREAAADKPAPINYIHASNPNLLDFEKSDFATPPKPAVQPPKHKPHKPDTLVGFVTLEEFMLKKQEEERRQVYTNRVLMGVERDRHEREREQNRAISRERDGDRRDRELQQRLDRIVPDVIYGELPSYSAASTLKQAVAVSSACDRSPRRPSADDAKPISVRGADGYEKIVYPAEAGWRRNDRVHSAADDTAPARDPAWPPSVSAVPRMRLRLDPKPHQASLGPGAREASPRPQYPHLQCPPTFQPETYSLARLTHDPKDA